MLKTITAIKQKDKKLLIEIDGEYHLFLYTRDLRKKSFKGLIVENSTIEDDEYESMIDHIITRGKRRVFHLLGNQDYPYRKLEQKLTKDGYIQPHIDLILISFKEKGFINDEALIERKVDQMKTYKSKLEVRYNLQQKGLNKDQIMEYIKDNYSEDDELTTAIKILNKKFYLKKLRLEEDELKKKALGFLSRKGYPFSICKKAFEEFMNNDED